MKRFAYSSEIALRRDMRFAQLRTPLARGAARADVAYSSLIALPRDMRLRSFSSR